MELFQALVDKKKMDQTKQSVTVLEHNLRRSNTSSNKQQKEVQKALDTAVTLRNTIKNLENKLDKQRKAISQIEEERDHYLHEATEQVDFYHSPGPIHVQYVNFFV